jgi:hypothetical protein
LGKLKVEHLQQQVIILQAMINKNVACQPEVVSSNAEEEDIGAEKSFGLRPSMQLRKPQRLHFDRAGFCGCQHFTGAGKDIVTLRLSGEGEITISSAQEDISISDALNRFPVCVYFTLKRGDMWSIIRIVCLLLV